MMYDRAVKRTTGQFAGRFFYVTGNHRIGIHAIGYCRSWPWDDVSSRLIAMTISPEGMAEKRSFMAKYHTNGHDTKEEACECYRQYKLDNHLRFFSQKDTAHRHRTLYACQATSGCSEYTASYASIGGSCQYWILCDVHRNRENVEKLFNVDESWHS